MFPLLSQYSSQLHTQQNKQKETNFFGTNYWFIRFLVGSDPALSQVSCKLLPLRIFMEASLEVPRSCNMTDTLWQWQGTSLTTTNCTSLPRLPKSKETVVRRIWKDRCWLEVLVGCRSTINSPVPVSCYDVKRCFWYYESKTTCIVGFDFDCMGP